MDKKNGGIMTEKSLKNLEIVVKAADDRLANDIIAMEVNHLTPLADYFVVMDARNDQQLKAIVEAIVEACDKEGIEIKNIEGKGSGRWILIDLIDVIVHVFHHSERSHYNIEGMWNDAPLVDLTDWVTPQ